MDASLAAAAEAASPPPSGGVTGGWPRTSATAVAGDNREDGGGTEDIDVESFRRRIDDITSMVDEVEKRVNQVMQFYSRKKQQQSQAMAKGGGGRTAASKEKERAVARRHVEDCERGNGKRTQELIRQFGTILRQIMQHKWAYPFMQPVDVEGLRLRDYYDIIKKPMDLGTIRNQMEAKDGTGYKNVREIYADVRLVFTNAMTYNDERDDVHVMARTLLNKFEEKWLQLLPKVIVEEETRRKEEAQAKADLEIAQEVAIARLAKDTSNEVNLINLQLDDLRDTVVKKCRKMTAEEKLSIATGLKRLPTEYIYKFLDIVDRHNPNFPATSQYLDFDIDAQSDSMLWRLKFFVDATLEQQEKNPMNINGHKMRRKREICDALAKTAKKRSRKSST